ncbi:MAG: hypothetical protein QM757_23870 [Paludibaculum sp.]
MHQEDDLPPFTFPDELTIKYEFAERPGMPPVTVYWYHHADGDAYLPPGMTIEEARKMPGKVQRWSGSGAGWLPDGDRRCGAGAGPGGTSGGTSGRAGQPQRVQPDLCGFEGAIWAPAGAAKVSACCPGTLER